VDQSRLAGEVISRRLAMRKEEDNCRTPLPVSVCVCLDGGKDRGGSLLPREFTLLTHII